MQENWSHTSETVCYLNIGHELEAAKEKAGDRLDLWRRIYRRIRCRRLVRRAANGQEASYRPFNYRVGVFGWIRFVAESPNHTSVIMAYWTQMAALQWVKRYLRFLAANAM